MNFGGYFEKFGLGIMTVYCIIRRKYIRIVYLLNFEYINTERLIYNGILY